MGVLLFLLKTRTSSHARTRAPMTSVMAAPDDGFTRDDHRRLLELSGAALESRGDVRAEALRATFG